MPYHHSVFSKYYSPQFSVHFLLGQLTVVVVIVHVHPVLYLLLAHFTLFAPLANFLSHPAPQLFLFKGAALVLVELLEDALHICPHSLECVLATREALHNLLVDLVPLSHKIQ